MKNLIGIVVLLMFTGSIHAQIVRNVNFTVHGTEIHITYDLLDTGDEAQANICLYYSLNKGIDWEGPISKNLSGDVGNDIAYGNAKKIIWKPLLSLPWFFSDYVMFKVAAVSGGDFTENIDGVNIEMIAVKGGTFKMGCTSEQSDCDDDEKPIHSVTVDDFYIGKYEVTQAQWKAIMGSNPSHFDDCGSNCPVENVSWKDVQEFIEKLNQKTGKNYRLPTEAGWEYAARGGGKSKGYKYAGSNSIGSIAWYDGNSGNKTHPVGQKQANELGIYDMSGNVWEWCSDWYDSDYYSSSPRNNPAGPSSGSYRVLRGGGWWSDGARYCRVAYRSDGSPDGRDSCDGFRLVLIP